jgi:hypothetical protein
MRHQKTNQIMQSIHSTNKRTSKLFPTCLLMAIGVLILTGLTASAQTTGGTPRQRTSASQSLPRGMQMKIRLETTIDTKEAKDGDRFTATVLTPSRYADSTIEGHIAKVKSSGKVTGKTELSLAFDRLQLPSGQTRQFAAQVVRIYGEGSAKEVDEEGTVKSGSQGKTTATRTAGGAAIGAVVGAIAGGGKGAAIGAAVGGAAGAGSVLIQGSKKLKLESGTEILIRTTR